MDTRPSAARLIQEYVDRRKDIAKIVLRHEEELKPYRDGLNLLENLLADEINRLEGQAIKTTYGTAYRSTLVSFKVADRETWLDWVIKNKKLDMLTSNVAKDAVKEFMENGGRGTPPGLNMTTIYKINVRSAED